jgi:membrane protease YdiL (CAAX protease family)
MQPGWTMNGNSAGEPQNRDDEMNRGNAMHLKPFRWRDYVWLYGIPTMLNFAACRWAIPFLEANTAWPVEIVYFISVGGMVLAPMFFVALYLTWREIRPAGRAALSRRMRVYKLSGRDWVWTLVTFVSLCIASFFIAKVLMPGLGLDATPFFFRNMPLDGDHLWILYTWPVFFFFNIFGEELYWRGYLQPRQELHLGKWTWLFHGLFWAVWHLPMGLDLVVASLPVFFILPAVVQRRCNTTIAIVVHAVFGAFGFLAIAFGGIH